MAPLHAADGSQAFKELKSNLAVRPVFHRLDQRVEAHMWDGESPVRVWREMRGMKAADLAAAVDVSRSYLSAIERGAKQGSSTP